MLAALCGLSRKLCNLEGLKTLDIDVLETLNTERPGHPKALLPRCKFVTRP